MSKVKYRLILDSPHTAFENMAIDEAILMKRREIGIDTLRLYTWRPSAVSIGYFQGIQQVLDLDAVKENRVDYIRRISGGGAVFHADGGEITYSIVTLEDNPLLPKKVVDSYPILSAGLIKGLRFLGLEPQFAGINDIIVNKKKISGNAQTRRHGGVLQHGTLLKNVNPELMFTLLKVSDEKMRDKAIKSFHERVTSLEHEGVTLSEQELMEALALGFSHALGASFLRTTLSAGELKLARKLREEKYETPEWNHKK